MWNSFYPESIFLLTNPSQSLLLVVRKPMYRQGTAVSRILPGYWWRTALSRICFLSMQPASFSLETLTLNSLDWMQVQQVTFCRHQCRLQCLLALDFSVAQYHLGTITRGLVSRLRGLLMVWRSQYLGPRLLVILPRLCRSFQLIKTNSWTWGCSALTSTIKECFHACRYWCIVYYQL